jgi:hypothetical protein
VTAESQGVGRGATFTVRLPMLPLPAEPVGAAAADLVQDRAPTLEGMSVLVVDDDD